jgi:putative DNA methylase
MKTKKKLIEVALPLEAINKASAREKSIRHGHPSTRVRAARGTRSPNSLKCLRIAKSTSSWDAPIRSPGRSLGRCTTWPNLARGRSQLGGMALHEVWSTLHLWWARRPLAAARAVIFAQMVDDPSANPDLFPTAKAQEKERQRLFKIIEQLVQWENTTNEKVLEQAREEIWQSWRRACAENADHPRAKELFDRKKLPAFHDPFAGGGTLPLEAQRLGLEAHASDLNPVAVLINKAMIEIPPKFAGKPPVNPEARKQLGHSGSWKGAEGLAEDVRYYGRWMRDEAEKRIGHLYPKVKITTEMAKVRPDLKPLVGHELTVIAWLWARTVKSPNPAFGHVDVPLASTFILSRMKGNEAYIKPIVHGDEYRFEVMAGKPADPALSNGTKLARGAHFRCIVSEEPISSEHVKNEARAGRMGAKMTAVVAEGVRGRVYLAPTPEMEKMSQRENPKWEPEGELVADARAFTPILYGIKRWKDLFLPRQLVALATFSELVNEARTEVRRAALVSGMFDDEKALNDRGGGAGAYSDAVGIYLGLIVSSLADRMSTICTWDAGGATWGTKTRNTFSRQAIPMTWDFAEVNPLSNQSGSIQNSADYTAKGIVAVGEATGLACQEDAAGQVLSRDKIVSTDPPYYDNVPYADLSDFFYVWLRHSLQSVCPELFATLSTPKDRELVASQYRLGGRQQAEAFFLKGMTEAMHRLVELSHPATPVTIYYAFKQSEDQQDGRGSSTGWETFLDAVIRAGFAITGTWPMRTELGNRMRSVDSNALASSIVVVCKSGPADASIATRREFVTTLKKELPIAVIHLQQSNIAPVDLAQAAIGPGMAVFTRYAKVLDAEGKPVTVREALALINQTLDETLAQQEGDFDADSRWALAWFDQQGFAEGEYGVAETLSKAKNTAVSGLVEAGILSSSRGKVRLLKPSELPSDWDPEKDKRLTVWETVHHLIRALEAGGEPAAAALVARLGSKAEVTRELAYRLYTLCERKKRATEALAYNGIVQSWPEIVRLARESTKPAQQEQTELFASKGGR